MKDGTGRASGAGAFEKAGPAQRCELEPAATVAPPTLRAPAPAEEKTTDIELLALAAAG